MIIDHILTFSRQECLVIGVVGAAWRCIGLHTIGGRGLGHNRNWEPKGADGLVSPRLSFGDIKLTSTEASRLGGCPHKICT